MEKCCFPCVNVNNVLIENNFFVFIVQTVNFKMNCKLSIISKEIRFSLQYFCIIETQIPQKFFKLFKTIELYLPIDKQWKPTKTFFGKYLLEAEGCIG